MSGLTEQAELEAAGDILNAMSGNYPSESSVHMDTDATESVATEPVATEPVATEGNVNIKDILSTIQTSAKLAKKVEEQSLKQLSSWVNTVFSIGDKTKELLISFKSDATEVIAAYNDKYETFKSTINDAYRKIEGKVEGGLENIGLKEQLDNIMFQHEKMLFIAMQLCYSKIRQGDLLEPNSDDIPGKVSMILDNEHKEQLMIHVRKLFETFYNRKLGISAVNSYNIVNSDQTIEGNNEGSSGFFARSNDDLIAKYNKDAIKETIDNTVENPDNLKQFLIHFIRNFKSDSTVNDIDHAKYFGYSQTLPEFVESIIGFNESNINFIDYELSKNSIKSRLYYYADLFKSGGSLLGYAKNIKDLYNNYEQLIIQTKTFIDGAKSEDFDNVKGANFDQDITDATRLANSILEQLREEQKAFVNDLIEKDDSPIKQIEKKQGLSDDVKDKITNFKNDITNHADGSKRVRTDGPGPGGGRKRKTRVAANKKRKTQKKKRPSRKMKVSRKKTQRRKKKGSKKKSMKNRK